MKKNGFTLVELVAVIVILGLLMAVAIPGALSIANKVKEQTYSTKIELIENSAKTFGQENISYLSKGTNLKNPEQHWTCKFTYDTNETLTKVEYKLQSSGYSDSKILDTNEYWCMRVMVEDLVDGKDLDWDFKDQCDSSCDSKKAENYNNIVINPRNSNIINKCFVYVYYKYNRAYAIFDKATCSDKNDFIIDGHEYPRI